ncbi:DUF6624 domain-containing protein [uncultured Aquimarina sp.]|uniref:DUF6624 domain-containing protein n=1 Tax=uncultured Aquimarina sp. TaxID=575652 RepID=UPI0026129056|nr:DUF6624 domain-containing protein [uncultured Aquimarina sp.]
MRNNKTLKLWVGLNICTSILLCSCSNTIKDNNNESQKISWTDSLIKAYEILNQNPSVEAADKLFQATERMPKQNWENYLVCATIYGPKGENDKAFNSIEKAIETGLKDSELLNTLPEFSSLKSDPRWDVLITKTIKLEESYLKSIQNPELLKALENLWKLDQQTLSEYDQNIELLDSTATDEDYSRLFTPVENRWEINRQKLDSIINIHGWPGYKLVGEKGAKISWAIPQHYPDVFFKEQCLSLIKKAIEKGDTDPNHYAELHDRIARATWQKQTFGASMGKDSPYPIEDPANVNDRRLALGLLEPIEVYAYYHGITYQQPSIEEAELQMKTARDSAQKSYKKFEELVTRKESDSANMYIRKAIKFYGDLSNEQLYNASIKLAQTNNKKSKKISLKIIKVLIWRKWEGHQGFLVNKEFVSLHTDPEWITVKELLQKSN